MKIIQVSCKPLTLKKEVISQPSWLSETVIANPMSIYPKYYQKRSSWTANFPTLAIVLDTDEGIQGLSLANGGHPVQAIIEEHFSQFCIEPKSWVR